MTDESSKTLPPEPPKMGETDSRLDSFLQRAAPVIAEERGFNPRSRVKLESIANDMRLPEELYDQAIHMLQGAPPVAGKPGSRWVEAFRQYLHARLERVTQGIVTVQMEARAIEVATTKFQLTEEQARETIRDVVKERGMQRISQSEAERHVEDLIHSKVGDAAWLDDATVTRLHNEGRQWGLSPEQVDAIIRSFTDENRRRQRRERRTVTLALTAAGLAAAVAIGFFVYIGFKDDDGIAKPNDGKTGTTNGQPSTPPKRREFKPPSWWEEVGLAPMAVQARLQVPSFNEYYYDLASPDAAKRIDAYDGIVKLFERNIEQRPTRELLRNLLSGIHAGEPDDDAAKRIREQFLALAVIDPDRLPLSSTKYINAFVVVSDAITMFDNGRLKDDRAKELELAIGRVTGVTVDRRAQRITLQRRCLWSLARRCYLQLIDQGPANPLLVSSIYTKLYELAARFSVNVEDLGTLESRLLAAVVPAAGREWTRFQPLIERCIVSKDPLNVLKVLEVFERSSDRDLQIFIVERLLPQVRAVPDSASVEDIAAAVREALGVRPQAAPKTARQRWATLEEKVRNVLPVRSSASDTKRLLRETIEVAHLATLACALAQHDPGFALFDQLVEVGPPNQSGGENDTTESDRSGPRGFPDAAKMDELVERVGRLKRFYNQKLPQRTTDLRGIAKLTDFIDDVNAEQGIAIATYLLTKKTEQYEHERIVEAVYPLSRWPHVLIALADQLPKATLPKPQVQELLAVLLAREDLRLADDASWRQSTGNMLLQQAVLDLTDRHGVLADPAKRFDNAEANLLTLYQTRGALLDAATHTAETPSQMLGALVRR
ncbi:MAG: hypothetical protein IH991_20565, partial [Planctomycetes bacterium]|nr:hypothetical protein [Planctomycetota bacterium]